MKTFEEVAFDAFQLSPNQQLKLVNEILAKAEGETDPQVEAEWEAVIAQRIRDYDEGRVKAIPGEEVFRELDRKLANLKTS